MPTYGVSIRKHINISAAGSSSSLSNNACLEKKKSLLDTKKKAKCQLGNESTFSPHCVSFSRGRKVAPEMMEPQGLKGKRCVLFDGHMDYGFLSRRADQELYNTSSFRFPELGQPTSGNYGVK